jgi:uncharacterized protein (TIGR02996 family)
MDLLSQHESFLRAIYDAPDDDTPRLVYADFLEEHGDPDRAAYIRIECEAARAEDIRVRELGANVRELVESHRGQFGTPWPWDDEQTTRGFPRADRLLEVCGSALFDPDKLSEAAVRASPWWYGATALKLLPPAIRSEHVAALFALPFTQQVRHWDLGGHVEEVAAGPETEDGGTFGLIDMVERPVITAAGVEALAESRTARRIETLVLTHNNLDNNALRALARSPYLSRLRKLDVSAGNRLSGKTWAHVIEKFGEDVVG